MLKLCRICQTKKPLNTFHKNGKNKDGLETRCKSCRKKLSHKKYEERKNSVANTPNQDSKVCTKCQQPKELRSSIVIMLVFLGEVLGVNLVLSRMMLFVIIQTNIERQIEDTITKIKRFINNINKNISKNPKSKNDEKNKIEITIRRPKEELLHSRKPDDV